MVVSCLIIIADRFSHRQSSGDSLLLSEVVVVLQAGGKDRMIHVGDEEFCSNTRKRSDLEEYQQQFGFSGNYNTNG